MRIAVAALAVLLVAVIAEAKAQTVSANEKLDRTILPIGEPL